MLGAALICLLVEDVQAVLLVPYDIETLIDLSQAVVLAKEVARQSVGNKIIPLKTLVIEKVYKGSLLPGMKIDVLDAYPRSSSRQDEPRLTFDPEVLLFLENWDPQKHAASFSGPKVVPTHAIVDFGIRLLKDNQMYEFGAYSTLGGAMHASPMVRPRAMDSEGTHFDQSRPVTLGDFEVDIERAIFVGAAIRGFLAKPDAAKERDTLFKVLGSADSPEGSESRGSLEGQPCFPAIRHELLGTVVKQFRDSGDHELMLEVMVRTDLYDFGIPTETLLAEATRRTCPARLRAAALRALDIWFPQNQQTVNAVVELLSEDDPEVRKAAGARVAFENRRYRETQQQTPERDAFWSRALARAHELEARFK